MKTIFLVRQLRKVVSYPSVRIVLVFGVFHVCFKRVAFTISHNVESGDQGANQSVFLFHTQMKGTSVTFIYLFSCALILGLCSYVSIFCVPNFCWGHEPQYDFKNITRVGCHLAPSLGFCHPHSVWTWELPLKVSFHSMKTHWVRIIVPRECFPRGIGFLFLNPWAGQGRVNVLSGSVILTILPWCLQLWALPSYQWSHMTSETLQTLQNLNICLYMRSLIGSEVKAVWCTEKTIWPWVSSQIIYN